MALPPDLKHVTKEGADMQVEFLLDYRSPYAYLANTQMKALTSVVYTPIDILAVMNKVNNQPSPLCPPKARYAGLDAGRWAKHYGVAFSPNGALLQAMGTRQFDGALLARAALAAQELGVFGHLNDVLFEAWFEIGPFGVTPACGNRRPVRVGFRSGRVSCVGGGYPPPASALPELKRTLAQQGEPMRNGPGW